MLAGKLCKSCAPGVCREAGTPAEPHVVACPECEEKGCAACGEAGTFEIPNCPQEWIDLDIAQVCRFAWLLKRGHAPSAGGILDQENWFLAATERLWRELARWDVGND